MHVSLLGTKKTMYRTIVSPISRRRATKGEVIEKAKKDQAA